VSADLSTAEGSGATLARDADALVSPQTPNTIAVLIAVISILGAIAAARAAWQAQEATLIERRHVQALMLRELQVLDIQGRVDHDHRLAPLYVAHALQADWLQQEARSLRVAQPDRAAWLDLRAQEERALRRATVPFFRLELPSTQDGRPAFNSDEIVKRRIATNGELRDIDMDITDSGVRLERAHASTWLLETSVAILVFSLLFLTLAMADIGGQSWRGALVGFGVGFAIVGLGVELLIEFGWAVDLFVQTTAH
jgi:hypothetical protein